VLTTTTLEVDEITTESVQETVKTIAPMMLIPILWKAVQEQQAQKDDLDSKCKTYEDRLAALEEALKGSAGAAAGALAQEVGLPGSATPAVDEETVKRTADAVLKELGINPWVEITMAEAWEEVEETVSTEVVKTVTKYRPNWETMVTESYTVEEKVVEKTPTGRKIKQLRPDARFDENTGKYFKRIPLSAPSLEASAGLTKPGADLVLQSIAARVRQITSQALSATRAQAAPATVASAGAAEKIVALRTANQLAALQVRFVAPPSGGPGFVVPPSGGPEFVAPPSGGVLSASASAAAPAKSKPVAR
jgi:hypothetical protein